MFDKSIQMNDATIKAGTGGVDLTCRDWKKHFTFAEFAEFIYPLLDQAAKADETQGQTSLQH